MKQTFETPIAPSSENSRENLKSDSEAELQQIENQKTALIKNLEHTQEILKQVDQKTLTPEQLKKEEKIIKEVWNILACLGLLGVATFEAFKIGNDPSSAMDYAILIGALIEFIKHARKIGKIEEKNIPDKKEVTI